jgi:D-alanyl-D-alanine carboxypeptidase
MKKHFRKTHPVRRHRLWPAATRSLSCKERGVSIVLLVIVPYTFLFSQNSLTSQWQQYLDSLVSFQGVTGIQIHVDAPKQNIDWTGAAGVAEISSLRPLTGKDPVRIASITKTFVAITIIRLWEEKKLDLDDPITKYISKEHADILQQGGYHPKEITIRHLLTHTSGLYDHGSSQTYLDKIFADPAHQWTRTEQLKGSMTWGKPVGKPGERFSYSDTGYILLGEIIEKITCEPLGIALRRRIDYDALDMSDTWFEITEEAPSHLWSRVHQYLDTIDTHDFHASLDLYGGGGIVTTVEDLTDFYRGLFSGDIYSKSSTLDMMIGPVTRTSTETPKLDYRMGIWKVQLDGLEAWTHSGFWGVQVWYVPELDAAIAVAATRQDDFGKVKKVAEEVVVTMKE